MHYLKKSKTLLQHNIIYYVVLFIAFSLYIFFNSFQHTSVYKSFNDEDFVISNVTKYDYGLKLDLKGKEKVIGYIYCEEELLSFLKSFSLGDKVSITGKKKDISSNTVPNTFNYKKYLESNKVYNVIVITDIKLIQKNKNIFYSVKNSLLSRTNKLYKSYPYIRSLLFGNNSYIEQSVMNSYRENGISHLFAISGLHIGLFMFLLLKILDRFKTSVVLKNFIIILFLIFYMFLTNFSMSVERCCIFTILILVNRTLGFGISTINLLLLTLSIILFINPLSLNNIGLQYSFLVTFFLIKYSYLITGNALLKLFKTSLISFFISYPVTVNNFYQVNLFSVIYNIFFVPYVSFILLPLVILAYIFPCLDGVLYIFIKIIESVSQFIDFFDVSKIILCKIDIVFILLYFILVCKFFSKNTIHKMLYLVFLLVFFIAHYFMPFNGENFIMFTDVGQGDSSIIYTNGSTIMIDTGGIVSYDDEEYNYTISKNKIIPYLKSVGIRKINILILTHGDFDHMGEAKYLVDNFKVKKVIFNCGSYNDLEKELIKVLDNKSIKYQSCINELNLNGTKFKFLQTTEFDNENDNSNVIYTELNGYKFMFMGDASVTTEEEIIKEYNLPNIDVLKVGHHGSNTSSSKEFINEINPKYSIISVGKNNRYGHPNKEVLDNLENSKIYRTDQDGSVMFKIKNNKLNIKTCTS